MSGTELMRDYVISDADLIQLADSKISAAKRDMAEMQDFGITDIILADINKKRDNFADMTTDEELEGMKISSTADKNAAADVLRKAIRRIMARVGNKYGVKSGKYSRFGVDTLSRMSDTELYKCGKRVQRQARALLGQLVSEGLTEADISDLETITLTFDTTIDAQDDAIRDRDIATQERITLGNDLYADVTRLSNTGKAIWEGTSEAKYNDYLILKQRRPTADAEETADPEPTGDSDTV